MTIGLYWPAMQCDFVNYDDDLYVSENLHVQGGVTWENVKWACLNEVNCNWEPLTILSHMVDCQIYGLRPWGHHLTNVLFHAVNAALVFVLLRLLGGAILPSFLAAILFAVHPLHVESVAWVAQRRDVLSGFFGLLSLCFYVRYAAKSGFWNYFLASSFLALGLMSKAMLITWPFVMLLLDYWPLNRIKGLASVNRTLPDLNSQPRSLRRLLIEKVPFFTLVVAAIIIDLLAQQKEGALKDLESLPLGVRIGNALVSYCRYLGKLFWPTDLAVLYPHHGSWMIGQVVVAGAFLLGISILFLVLRRRYPFLLIGWLWFVGTLVPVIQLVQTGGHAMADRYTYLPSLGILLVATWGGIELAKRWHRGLIGITLASSVVVVLLLAVSRNQLAYWRNSETLFRHTVEVTRLNPIAEHNLGDALMNQGQLDEAIRHFKEAIRMVPDYDEAHNSLGNALARKGKPDEAAVQFREAIRLKPAFATAHANLGIVLAKKGKFEEATPHFQEAISLNPDWAAARYDFGLMLEGEGQMEQAIRQFQEVVRLEPNNANAHDDLGHALDTQGQADEAIREFQAAISLKPDCALAHCNLGAALGRKGDLPGAILHLEEALRLNPDDVLTRYNLGAALGQQGRTNEAILHLQAALRLKPDFIQARNLMSTLDITNAPTDR